MNNYKIKKYVSKYIKTNDNKYVKNIYSHIGGSNYSIDDLNNILKYINEQIKNTDHNQKQNDKPKYCILLIGPPASGKSKAFDLGISFINRIDNIDLSKSNFLEISIDKIVENTQEWINFKKSIDENTYLNNEQKIQQMNEKYFEIRKKADPIFEIFLNYVDLLGLNFSLETVGDKIDWYIDRLKELSKSNRTKFKFVCMYPYTDDVDMLLERADKRALTSGRYILKDYLNEQLINDVSDKYNTKMLSIASYFFIMCKYDAKIPLNALLKDLIEKHVISIFLNCDKYCSSDGLFKNLLMEE